MSREARFERYRVALREVILDVIDGENATEDDCADEVAKEAMTLADAEHAALTTEVERLNQMHRDWCVPDNARAVAAEAEVERLTRVGDVERDAASMALRGAVHEIKQRNASIERAHLLIDSWQNPELDEVAEVRSANGDNTLAIALSIRRALADKLRHELEGGNL